MISTKIVGIINVTPDSFYDGGKAFSIQSAQQKAEKFLNEGANWIEIGGESTRPNSTAIDPVEEQNRVLPVIRKLIKEYPQVNLSIDTRNSSTALHSIDLGVKIVNDVSAGRHDPEMFQLIAKENVKFVMMHSRGNPQSMQSLTQYENLLPDIHQELQSSIHCAYERGVEKDKIIIDPGIGFAKNANQNFFLIRNLREIKKWDYPVCLGASRKSFIGAIDNSDADHRLGGSIAVAVFATMMEVDYLRVHDVKETVQAVRVIQRLLSLEGANL